MIHSSLNDKHQICVIIGFPMMHNSQVGQWKFLGFSGEFSTTLYVHQDKKAGKVSTLGQLQSVTG